MGAPLIDSPLMRVIDRKGLKRSHVARRLGLPQYALSKIERGARRPPAQFYEKAALLLGVELEKVLPETKEVRQAA